MTTGRISKEGSALVCHVLVKAAHTSIRSPGPLRAFFERVRARRGHAVAVARKMRVLFWQLLTRGEDYTYQMPIVTAKKLRKVELLVREGARGVALMARDAERLAVTAGALRDAGGDVLELAGDVRRIEDLTGLVEAATARWGRIDGVANNGGELAAGPFAGHDDGVWEEDLALKLMGAVRLIRLALPALRESKVLS